MELLLSSIPPIRKSNLSFQGAFEDLLEETDHLKIASGYISTDSLTEIKKIVEENQRPYVELFIGMHFFEGITKTQYQAAKYLNSFLNEKSLGKVYISNTFKFHGKLYSFKKTNSILASIVGSSNLSNILDTHRNFETDILLDDASTNLKIDNFITELSRNAGIPLDDWIPESFIEANPLLEGHENVKHCNPDEIFNIVNRTTPISFNIPLKTAETAAKSNLNAYFGKGREDQRGFIRPRHWYEVELIVPKEITDNPDYPKAGYPDTESIITVYTDDGWKFDCKISGDYSKNFRSCHDLKILGKWIKGRLENNGALQIGEPVTQETLRMYGRDSIKLTATDNPQEWYLDFNSGSVE